MKIRLKALRVNAGYTQNQVSSMLHVAKATIVNWEADKTFPTGIQLQALCKLYGCGMDDIFVPETLTEK